VAFLEVLSYEPAFVLPVFAKVNANYSPDKARLYTQRYEGDTISDFELLSDRRSLVFNVPVHLEKSIGQKVLYGFKVDGEIVWDSRKEIVLKLMGRLPSIVGKPTTHAQVFDMIFGAPNYEESSFLHGDLTTYLGALVFERNAKAMALTPRQISEVIEAQQGARERDVRAGDKAVTLFDSLKESFYHFGEKFVFVAGDFEGMALLMGLRATFEYVRGYPCISIDAIGRPNLIDEVVEDLKKHCGVRAVFYLCADDDTGELLKRRISCVVGPDRTIPIFDEALTRLARLPSRLQDLHVFPLASGQV
jgi:hypothetical protein